MSDPMGLVVMEVSVLEEAGYWPALHGISLNKKQPEDEMKRVAANLCRKDGGHNKFLEAIYVWLSVRAPRYWWQEADTYRISTKQSESTMHTLYKELETIINSCNGTSEAAIRKKREMITSYIFENFESGSICTQQMENMLRLTAITTIYEIKKMLPEGFLQRRLWCMNYKCLRNIILQRRNHRLPHWKLFIGSTLAQIAHPELLPTLENGDQDGTQAQENNRDLFTHTQEYDIPDKQTPRDPDTDDKPLQGRDHIPTSE